MELRQSRVGRNQLFYLNGKCDTFVIDCIKTKIEAAHDREADPEARRNLDALADKIEMDETGLKELSELIELIQSGE